MSGPRLDAALPAMKQPKVESLHAPEEGHLPCKHENSFQAFHFLLEFLFFPTNWASISRTNARFQPGGAPALAAHYRPTIEATRGEVGLSRQFSCASSTVARTSYFQVFPGGSL